MQGDFRHLVRVQGGGQRLVQLVEHPQAVYLMGLLVELGVTQGHAHLPADGGQQLMVLLGVRIGRLPGDVQHAQDLVPGGERDPDVAIQVGLGHDLGR